MAAKTQLLLVDRVFCRGTSRRRDFSSNALASDNAPFYLASLPSVTLWKGLVFPAFLSAFSLAWTSLALSNFFLSFFYIGSPIARP